MEGYARYFRAGGGGIFTPDHQFCDLNDSLKLIRGHLVAHFLLAAIAFVSSSLK